MNNKPKCMTCYQSQKCCSIKYEEKCSGMPNWFKIIALVPSSQPASDFLVSALNIVILTQLIKV